MLIVFAVCLLLQHRAVGDSIFLEATLENKTRQGMLVEAVERLGDPYVLLLIGAGAGAPSSDRVICMDYQSDPVDQAAILAGCDAFVHANDNEPFGLIVLEAMACGLPVIGIDAGGVAESVDASVGGLASASEPGAFADLVVFDPAAIAPEAPVLFSTTTGWPVFCAMPSP